jgi:hypothetical protein
MSTPEAVVATLFLLGVGYSTLRWYLRPGRGLNSEWVR